MAGNAAYMVCLRSCRRALLCLRSRKLEAEQREYGWMKDMDG